MLKKILVIIGTVVAVLVLGFVGVVAMQPADFRISRSASISATPEAVFEQVNDFHNWDAWSPWAKLDPAAKNSFDGPDSGEGARFSWAGNDKVGEGSMTITESKPSELVRIKLAFLKPMEDTSDTLFTFEPDGKQTKVTWTMSGKNNFMGKAFCLVMNMQKMIGGKFEEGLASMKSVVEKQAAKAPAGESESDKPAATGDSPPVNES